MRTIELDGELVDETVRITGATSDREAIESALRKQIELFRQAQAGRELFGSFAWQGNLEQSRLGHVED